MPAGWLPWKPLEQLLYQGTPRNAAAGAVTDAAAAAALGHGVPPHMSGVAPRCMSATKSANLTDQPATDSVSHSAGVQSSVQLWLADLQLVGGHTVWSL